MSFKANEKVLRGERIELDGVSAGYGGQTIIDNLTLTVGAGEFTTLLGPSGCGKTTTLRLVAGLVNAQAGRISIGDRDVTNIPVHRRKIAMVFQNYALMPHYTVNENVAYGLARAGVPRGERQALADSALARVGLEGFGDRTPSQLSGGQQQRVGVARAVAVGPAVMLLDEPLSNLDTSLRQRMGTELRKLQQDLGVTILYVTHDRNEALSMSDNIGVMSAGRIVDMGTPEDLYMSPSAAHTARLLGDINEMPAQVGADGIAHIGPNRVGVPLEKAFSGQARLVVRPEKMTLALATDDTHSSNAVDGVVEVVSYAGNHLDVAVSVEGVAEHLIVRLVHLEGARPLPGQGVKVRWKVEDTMVFKEEA